MLPDFPNLKRKLQKLLIYRMKRIHSASMPSFYAVPKRVFEGNRLIVVWEDGSSEELKIKEDKAKIDLNLQEVETITPDIILDKIDAAAKEIAMQQSKRFFEQIDKAVNKVGNVIDVKGRSLCIDDYFQLLEKIWIDFDENGEPILPTSVPNEKTLKSISKVLSQLKTDPECKKRYAEIIERKKEEWRVRESNRKLVG
ncbi:MAG: hypothetical protein AB1567_02585 [bacterium]